MWLLSTSKFGALAAATTSLLASFAPSAASAETIYRRVHAGDIIMGYVPAGEPIETSGYFWFSDGAAFLNVARPSAHVPLMVDVTRLPPQKKAKAQSACASTTGLNGGGCQLTIRGVTAMVSGRRAVLASDIDLP